MEQYVEFIREHHASFDFIIFDLGLSTEETDELKQWYTSKIVESSAPETLFRRATGVRVLNAIVTGKVFDPERIAVYTQFNPDGDTSKDLQQLSSLMWNGTVIPVFYKDVPTDAVDLKALVEKACNVATHSLYYCCNSPLLANRIHELIQNLDEEMADRLIKPFRVDTLAGADERYGDEYQRHRFSVAIIELVHSDSDRDKVNKAQAGDRDALRQISTIPLIQAIETHSGRKTQIVVLTNGDYSPRMVRSLKDKEIGVDWVINATRFDANFFFGELPYSWTNHADRFDWRSSHGAI